MSQIGIGLEIDTNDRGGTMQEAKMTNIIVSTDHFVTTLTYPVKNKITQPVSKKITMVLESVDAVLEVSPTALGGKNRPNLAEEFFSIISVDSSIEYSKSKREHLLGFIADCNDKERGNIKSSLNLKALENISKKVATLIITLLSKDGEVVSTRRTTVADCLFALGQILNMLSIKKEKKPKNNSL